MTFETLRGYLLAKPGAVEDFPFDPVTLAAKVGGRIFALVGTDADPLWLNLKCEPEKAEALREIFPAVAPGYHMNKRHWNTLTLDGSMDDTDVFAMIDDSYALVARKRSKRDRPGRVRSGLPGGERP